MWEWCGPYSFGRNAGCCVSGLARSGTYSRILFQATIKSPKKISSCRSQSGRVLPNVAIKRTACLIHVLEVLASHLGLGI